MNYKRKKYYVVWVGRTPGIYDRWDECSLQHLDYDRAMYKGFCSQMEAANAFTQSPYDYWGKNAFKKHLCCVTDEFFNEAIDKENSISVNASTKDNHTLLRVVDTVTDDKIIEM